MPFRINHIHIKGADPRKAAEWWARAFVFKIVSDETRVFGDRFVRCLAEGGSMTVSISYRRQAIPMETVVWDNEKPSCAVTR